MLFKVAAQWSIIVQLTPRRIHELVYKFSTFKGGFSLIKILKISSCEWKIKTCKFRITFSSRKWAELQAWEVVECFLKFYRELFYSWMLIPSKLNKMRVELRILGYKIYQKTSMFLMKIVEITKLVSLNVGKIWENIEFVERICLNYS